jgi:hypothetical protein
MRAGSASMRWPNWTVRTNWGSLAIRQVALAASPSISAHQKCSVFAPSLIAI